MIGGHCPRGHSELHALQQLELSYTDGSLDGGSCGSKLKDSLGRVGVWRPNSDTRMTQQLQLVVTLTIAHLIGYMCTGALTETRLDLAGESIKYRL